MKWIWSLLILGFVFGATEGRILQPEQRADATTTADTEKKPESPAAPASPTSSTLSTSSTSSTSPAPQGSSTTAKDKYTLEEEKLTKDLEDILSKYERECIGNPEFSANLDKVRKAIKWNNGTLEQKYELKFEFDNYNKLRIDLEKKIDIKIETLNEVLPTLEPNSYCSKKLLKQREALKKAKQLSNEGKQDSLTVNSKECDNTDDDSFDYNY